MKNTILSIDASHPQHTPAGDLVGKMYYGGFLDTVLKCEEYSGYPHNGGSHTLILHLNNKDVHAFMDLVRDAFGNRLDGVEEFIQSIRSKLANREAIEQRMASAV